jgi:hypothetical protein
MIIVHFYSESRLLISKAPFQLGIITRYRGCAKMNRPPLLSSIASIAETCNTSIIPPSEMR